MILHDESTVVKYTNVNSIHSYFSYREEFSDIDETFVTVYDTGSDTDSGLRQWKVIESVDDITKLIG